MLVNTVFAFSASDVWASGPTDRGGSVTLRYNRSSWHRASLPGAPAQVSALSANDIWAIGPSAKTASARVTSQVIVAMRVLPVPAGYNSTGLGLSWSPHSRVIWAIGYAHASNDSGIGLVERYTP